MHGHRRAKDQMSESVWPTTDVLPALIFYYMMIGRIIELRHIEAYTSI